MTSQPNQLPQPPSPETNFPPTAEGFRLATMATVERYKDAIQRDGAPGTEKLVLRNTTLGPEALDETITITPMDSRTGSRQFYKQDGTLQYDNLHLIYDAPFAPGAGKYRMYDSREDGWAVDRQRPHADPDLRRGGASEPVKPSEVQYDDLLGALARFMPEQQEQQQPVSRVRRVLHGLGNIARKHS